MSYPERETAVDRREFDHALDRADRHGDPDAIQASTPSRRRCSA